MPLRLLFILAILPATSFAQTQARDDQRADSSRRGPRRIPVTAEHLATAFRDAGARELLLGARRARLSHDSALRSYDATTYQRVSVGLSLKAIGRDRLMFRHENARRVRWEQGVGARVEVLGARTVLPSVNIADARKEIDEEVNREMGRDIGGIPYFPGQESLWIGMGMASTQVDERELVHPLAEGSEAYYRYATGDSMRYLLPQGATIRLRELRIQPREPKWNLVAGSFWFDVASGQLVRAAYRPSVPMDIWEIALAEEPDAQDDIPAWVMPMISPMRATVSVITVEYGLFEGRFWLPRLQAAEAEGQVSLMRAPVRIEERYDYASVNGGDPMLPIPVTARVARADTLAMLDSLAARGDSSAKLRAYEMRETARAASLARMDSLRVLDSLARLGDSTARATARAMRRPPTSQCDTSDVERVVERRYRGAVRIITSTPCDPVALMNSPALPQSAYDPAGSVFNLPDMAELRGLLDMGLQAEWAPQPIRIEYGYGNDLLRYNRVEGLSPAIRAKQVLGRGYSADALARIGLADLEPNGEIGIARSDGQRTLRLAAFRRLAVMNDWGTPFSMSSSLSSLLFARDEGFYYRTWGAELIASGVGNPSLTWRAFAERHDNARVETQLSVPRLLNNVRFLDNITASSGQVVGAGARIVHTLGQDPRGFRLLTDLRGESAVGNFTYTRALADLTFSRALLRNVDGSLTLSAGHATRDTPPQRWFALGGTQTIRGQQAGAMMGPTFWMTRAELGTGFVTARPVVFADLGWAGQEEEWSHPGRPASGVGIGASFMDGLIRFDLARGIHPRKEFRFDAYFEARF